MCLKRPVLVAFRGLLVYRLQGGRRPDVWLLMSVPADSDGITFDWLTAARAKQVPSTTLGSRPSSPALWAIWD